MTTKNILAIVLALLALVGLYFGSLYLREKTSSRVQDDVVITQPGEAPAATFRYKYVPNYDPGEEFEFNENTFDGKIVQIDLKTGLETVMIPSIKAAYPEIRESVNYSLMPLEIKNVASGNIYFTKVLYESDAGPMGIIRYDSKTNSLKKLSTSDYYRGMGVINSELVPYAVSIVNPHNDKAGRTLFLLDFENDKATVLDRLPLGQTYNFCSISDCLGEIGVSVTWLNEKEFDVQIFDANYQTPSDNYTGQLPYLEKRKYNLR